MHGSSWPSQRGAAGLANNLDQDSAEATGSWTSGCCVPPPPLAAVSLSPFSIGVLVMLLLLLVVVCLGLKKPVKLCWPFPCTLGAAATLVEPDLDRFNDLLAVASTRGRLLLAVIE